jgi:hypothetical protein
VAGSWVWQLFGTAYGALPAHIDADQARIDSKTLAANQTFAHAPRNRRPDHHPHKVAVAKSAMPELNSLA